MLSDQTLVRKLALRAQSRTALGGIVPEIDDALRTVSWPGKARRAGAVLMIRRINLGRLRRGVSRFEIARRLSERISKMSFEWSADPKGHARQSDVALWRSRAELLAHCAVHLSQDDVAQDPWWVASALKTRDHLDCSFSDLAVVLRQGWRTHGPKEITAVMAYLAAKRHTRALGALLDALALEISGYGSDWLTDLQSVPALRPDTEEEWQSGSSHETVVTETQVSRLAPDCLTQRGRGFLDSVQSVATRHRTHASLQLGLLALAAHFGAAPGSRALLTRRIKRACLADARRTAAQSNSLENPTERLLRTTGETSPEPTNNPSQTRKKERVDNATVAHRLTEPEFALQPDEQQTSAAGLLMLLNVIQRLRLPQSDAAAGIDMSLRVLRRFAERCPGGAIYLEALPEPVPCLPEELWHWRLNDDVLQELLPRQHQLSQNGFLTFRRAGCNVGAFGSDKVAFLRAVSGVDDPMADLVDGLSLVVQREVFLMTGTGWRPMVARRGLFAATETHLDVTLDLEDVRLNERRAGFDLSPGWVPWLGCVVTLHFERLDRKSSEALQ